ncbi:uncharacterized protein [Rutidosis leptorrhynchoides]|uniref:uncharacterized protein n=1 Tax=Rutidosis leptorrhynchoides TaxID=125765 RepID=UPI003A9A07EE
MAATITNESKISIKVTVDKHKKKVVYAEADHSFVDVLFSFMTLPMGAIARLLNKQSDGKNGEVLKSLNNLYQSLLDLPDHIFMNEECKHTILNPRSPTYRLCRKLKVNIDETSGGSKNHFRWGRRQVDDNICVGDDVFVSDAETYIVTDDLRVMPYTPGCCIQLLVDLGVKDAGHIEIIDLLGLSLSCDSPLTFLVLYPSRDIIISQQGIFDLCTSAEEKDEPNLLFQVSLQKSTGKFLFAEGDGDFVSGFLAISLGTVIGNFINGKTSLFCTDNIYKSI